MVEASTFLKHFRGATEKARRDAIEHAVRLALKGDLPSLQFLFKNAGEAFLKKEPLVTFIIQPPGTPCPTCGKVHGLPPEP